MFRIVTRLLLGILALCFVAGSMPLPAPERPSSRPDLPDTIRRLSGAGEIGELPRDVGKVYRVPLKKGELIHISAKQMGADVALVMIDPARNDLFKVDSFATTEQLFFVAPEAGVYGVRVEDGGAKTAGRYLLRVEDFRVATDRDRKNAQAETAYYTAKGLLSKNSFKDAESFLLYAIQAWQDLGNKARQADAYQKLGDVRKAARDLKGALDAYQQAASLRISIRDFNGQADAIKGMANIHLEEGKFQQAEPLFLQDLAIRRRVGDRKNEIEAIYNLGRVEQVRGELEMSLDSFSQVIEACDEERDKLLKSKALNARAYAYILAGMNDRAMDDLDHALRLTDPWDLADKAVILTQKAAIYREQGKLEQALVTANEAVALRKQIRDARGEGVSLSALGATYFGLGRMDDALNAFQRSTQIFRDGKFPADEINSSVNLGLIHALQGRTDLALKIFNDALLKARAGGNKVTEARLLHGLAIVEQKRGNPIAAMAWIDQAIVVAESIRGQADRRDLRMSFLADREDLYGLKIELLMDQRSVRPGAGYDFLAFQTSERARARGLYDTLAEDEHWSDLPAGSRILEEHQRLEGELNETDQQLRRSDLSKVARRELESRLRDLLGKSAALEAQRRDRGGWAESLRTPPALTLWEIQNRILDPDTVLVEYYLGAKTSFVWAVTPTTFQSFEIECSDLREVAGRVYQRMADGDAQDDAASADLERLSNCVLGKVAGLLSGKRVLVAAHGELQKIPFSALLEPAREGGSSPPLIFRHEVVSVPSLGVLSLLQKQRAAKHAPKRFLSLVADPIYNDVDERLPPEVRKVARQKISGRPEPYGFSRLLGSHKEAKAIINLTRGKGLSFEAAMGFRATQDWVKQGHMSNSRVVYFATHGIVNEAYPQLSGLVLSQFDRQGHRHDGLLRVHEIDDLKLDADLVVLSACQTALGKDVRGEGLLGLTQSLFAGGASSVLVSLWEVDDHASAELMKHFYGYLLAGRSPAASLRMAQRRMMESGPWRSPSYWSGFVLQGDWMEGGATRRGLRK
jgi:CHAT domain-containing protein